MSQAQKSKLDRLLELPCVSVIQDVGIVLNFRSRWHMTMELLLDGNDPVGQFITATLDQRARIMEAFDEKLRVLAEIQNGTNRYKIVDGHFEKVGEDG